MKIRLSFTAWSFVSLLYVYTLVRDTSADAVAASATTGHRAHQSILHSLGKTMAIALAISAIAAAAVHHHKVVRAPMERRAGELTHTHTLRCIHSVVWTIAVCPIFRRFFFFFVVVFRFNIFFFFFFPRSFRVQIEFALT